jgi:hypothetical protein
VFPVTVALDEAAMTIDDAVIPLTPGMAVTVEIKTDPRRVVDDLLSPLAKIASEAARERQREVKTSLLLLKRKSTGRPNAGKKFCNTNIT